MKRLLLALTALAALPAQADRLGLPAAMPAAYTSECGSCHTPFPPALLSAADWKRTLAGLDRHFGSDAGLDAATAADISAWLGRNAGRRGDVGGKEPRITASAWFVRKHDEVPARVWRDPRVKSAANCAACHPRADQGGYGERDIVMPGVGRQREDH
jgi:mono/diheme cytochrome c family protein